MSWPVSDMNGWSGADCAYEPEGEPTQGLKGSDQMSMGMYMYEHEQT